MIKDVEGLVRHITDELQKHADIAVIGLSGGADSTLVATLCTLAFGPENVYGVHMPYGSVDDSTFNSVSEEVAEALKIKSLNAPIYEAAIAINRVVELAVSGLPKARDLTTLNQGNARSRARMTVLYGICHHIGEKLGTRARVIGTGNLSEDYIGYDTKGGDALCDIFPIGELFKSEVYQLLSYLADKELLPMGLTEGIIEQPPSAGLWDGQTDEEELGHTYKDMEVSIRKYHSDCPQEFFASPTVLDIFVSDRHNKNKHKHEAPPVINLREFCD